jgi:hypothetical protein
VKASASPRPRVPRRLFVFLFFIAGDHRIIFVIVALCVHRGQLQRIAGNHLEVGPTFTALNYIAFFNVIDVNIQRVIAFRTDYRHKRVSSPIVSRALARMVQGTFGQLG